MKTAVLSCGALAREVRHICKNAPFPEQLFFVEPLLHLYPSKLQETLAEKLQTLQQQYEQILVVYGQCLPDMDRFLADYNAQRVSGAHCLEMIGGDRFWEISKSCPGTYFLIPSWIISFPRAIVEGLRLEQEPRMKEIMFRHYKKVVYFDTLLYGDMDKRVGEIAQWLDLPLEIERVGTDVLHSRMVGALG